MIANKYMYAVSTGFMILITGFGSIMDLTRAPIVMESSIHLQLPIYWVPFLGTMKILGTIAILQTKNIKIQEAGYAGLIFCFIGATYSHIMVGDNGLYYLATILILIIVLISYKTRKK